MEFKELAYFAVMAEELNLSRAAEKLIVDQSTLSKALGKLEKKAGTPLFFRMQNGLEMTDAGTRFLEITRRLLKLKNDMDDELRVIAKGLAGRVHLGISHTFSKSLVPRMLPAFNRNCPDVEVIIHTETSALLEEMLAAGDIDVAVVVKTGKNRDISYETLFHEQILLAVSPANPLATKGEERDDEDFPFLAPDLLSRERFILSQNGMRLRDSAEAFFKAEGILYDIAVTTASITTAMHLASRDVGIAFIPYSSTLDPAAPPDLAFLCTAPSLADWNVSIAVKKKSGVPPLIKRFVKSFKDAM